MAQVNAHKLVAKTAKEMAEELYEQVMSNNALYAHWKGICPELNPNILRIKFIRLMIPNLLDAARATLAKLLTGTMDERLKDQISDALIKDAALGRRPPQARRQHIILN